LSVLKLRSAANAKASGPVDPALFSTLSETITNWPLNKQTETISGGLSAGWGQGFGAVLMRVKAGSPDRASDKRDGKNMWLLDRFSNPLWYKASRLDKRRRRTVATTLCAYDFLRQQVDKKLVGPVETYLRENRDPSHAGIGLTVAVRTELVDEGLMALLWSCTCPAFDPGLKLPREVVPHLPEIWGSCVLADVNHRLNRSTPATLDQTGYSEDPAAAHQQVLSRWSEILNISAPEFADKVNAGSFAEAWDWLAQIFIADTLDGMAAIPDRLLFTQARGIAGSTPPHRVALVERLIAQVAGASTQA
jgi:hypothetical protein